MQGKLNVVEKAELLGEVAELLRREQREVQPLLDMADALTKKFIEKCESRRAFSVETLKECREFQKALETYRNEEK
jgi:hypothetical protein